MHGILPEQGRGEHLFPIPFKLCRNDLMVCLEACLENKAPEQQLQQLNAKRKHVRRHSKTEDDESQIALELLVNDDDYDQDDFDAFDEIHRLHQKLRLESDPYFCKEEDREQVMSANKRQRLLHKEEWFSSQWSKHSKIEKQAGLAIYSQDLQRNSDCTAHCQDKLACGTVTASDYATGLDSVFDSSY
ncbi:hypothetical protein BG004_006882 [Podila humilis]|nr:hypothetical protein BG004_006882 [Podila humilis]